MNQASFTAEKAILLEELLKMTKSLGRISKTKMNIVLELTITNNLLTLVIPGIKLAMKCETKRTAKATIGLYYFKDIIENSNSSKIECIVTDNEMKIGSAIFKCQTTFFETDSILRSIKLPINYTDYHVLQLENKGYTIEELRFNELEFVVYQAKKNLKKNIAFAKEVLGVYGFTTKELEELINKKINL